MIYQQAYQLISSIKKQIVEHPMKRSRRCFLTRLFLQMIAFFIMVENPMQL
jgi:hypothetical protein